jgi:gas vesicle protein
MGEEPQMIRSEIEQTRERMGDTMDAIGYKTDVKSRTKENIQGKVGTAKEKLGLGSSKAGNATPDAQEIRHKARRGAHVAQENPLGLAVGGVAVGFLAGLLVPVTHKEHETLGPMADQVKDEVKQTGQEALERGKEVAQSAAETAKQEGAQHADKLKASAQENADRVGPG